MSKSKRENPDDYQAEEIQVVSLEMADGTTEECEILATLDIDDKTYVALLPMEKVEYYIFECRIDQENDEIEIINIEDTAINEKVISAFGDLFEEWGQEDDDEGEEDDEEDDEDTIVIEMDDGSEVVADVIGSLEIDTKTYVAVLPKDEDAFMVFIRDTEDDEYTLSSIEDQAEYEKVYTAFCDLFEGDEDEDDDEDDDEE
jgi:hypothetical protein